MRGGGANISACRSEHQRLPQLDGVARSHRRWTIYDNPTNPFRGWSMVTVVVAVLGAVGGILVALVIKYADGLAKSLSTASSIVLTTAASHFLFAGPMSSPIIIGSLIVIISGYNYQNVQ